MSEPLVGPSRLANPLVNSCGGAYTLDRKSRSRSDDVSSGGTFHAHCH